MTGPERAASGVTGCYFRVIRGNMVAFVLNTGNRLPPIAMQTRAQSSTANCN